MFALCVFSEARLGPCCSCKHIIGFELWRKEAKGSSDSPNAVGAASPHWWFVLLVMGQASALESDLAVGERALRGIAVTSEKLKLKQILALFASS